MHVMLFKYISVTVSSVRCCKISDKDCHGMLWFQHLGLELNAEKEGLGICVTYGTVFIKRYLQTVPRM
jgi:hypothetical protein